MVFIIRLVHGDPPARRFETRRGWYAKRGGKTYIGVPIQFVHIMHTPIHSHAQTHTHTHTHIVIRNIRIREYTHILLYRPVHSCPFV